MLLPYFPDFLFDFSISLDLFSESASFGDALKSGVILCRVLNKISPGTITTIHKSSIAYMQMENIGQYIKGCVSIGMPGQDNFDTPDLYNMKNLTQVVTQIHRLARFANKKYDNVPPIGNADSQTLWNSAIVETKQVTGNGKEQELTVEEGRQLTEKEESAV